MLRAHHTLCPWANEFLEKSADILTKASSLLYASASLHAFVTPSWGARESPEADPDLLPQQGAEQASRAHSWQGAPSALSMLSHYRRHLLASWRSDWA